MNSLEAALVIGYVIVLGVAIVQHPWFRSSGLNRWQLLCFWGLHVATAIAYGLLHDAWYEGGDTFNMFHTGLAMYDLLWIDSVAWAQAMLGPVGTGIPDRLAAYPDALDYWYHYSSYSMVRLHALLRLFSFGYYYVHAVLLALIAFWAFTLLVKTFHTYRQGAAWVFGLWLLAVPSVLFFGHGLHKEALVIIALSVLLYRLIPMTGRPTLIDYSWIAAALLLILSIKEFYFAALVVPLFTFLLSRYVRPLTAWMSVGLTVGVWVLIGGLSEWVLGGGIWERLAWKQELFFALQGNSNVDLPPIHSIADLPKVSLHGLVNVSLRPWPSEWIHWRLGLYGMENYTLLLLLGYTLWRQPSASSDRQHVIFLFSFLVLSLLIIGIVVPNLGAIARYKAPAVFMLMVTLLLYWHPPKK